MKPIKLLWLCLVCHSLAAQTPDLNFGTNGFVMYEDWPYLSFDGGTIQNNRLLLKSSTNVIGHSLDGTMDFDFGDNGLIDGDQIIWQWGLASNLNTSPRSVAVNSNYSILVANADEYDPQFNPINLRLAFHYFNNNGTPATGLPNNGILELPFDYTWTGGNIEFSPDNSKAYLCFEDIENPPTAPDSLCVISVTENGNMNSTWGNNGISYLNYSTLITGYSDLVKLCPADDGAYLLIHFYDNGHQYCVIRFNSTGQYDATFGVKILTQLLSIQSNDEVEDMVISNNAAYMLAKNRKIYKLTLPNFTLDASFGNSGVATASPSNGQYTKLKIIDGKIYGIGSTLASGINKPLLSRHNADGSIDNSFGTNGSIMEDWPQFVDESAFLHIIPAPSALYVGGKSYFISQSGHDDYEDDFVVKYNLAPTGLNETNANAPKIYPNPASDLLVCESNGTFAVKLYNSQGQLVKTLDALNSERLDVSSLLQGIYIAEITNRNGIYRTRIVKQ